MRRLRFLLNFFTITLLLHVYLGLRLLPALGLDAEGMRAGIVLLVLLYGCLLLGLLGRVLELRRLADPMAWIGMLALGLFSSLFVLTVLREFSLIAAWAASALWHTATLYSAWRHASAVAVPLLAMLLTCIGFLNARRRARVVEVEVPIAGLPAALEGFTIAQISDLHVGPTIKRKYIDAIVDAVNALQADMIAVTGDVVDGKVPDLRAHTQPLARLSARHGSFFVTGNHEYYSGAADWIAEFRRLGLTVLLNEHVILEHGRAQLLVAGVTDYSAGSFDPEQRSDPLRALAGAPADVSVKLLLAHQPRSASAAASAGYTLQLSGHTHGGQFLPWNFFVRFQQPFLAGLERLGSLWVYTSRGTGYWGPPKRLGAPSEITRLRLTAAPAA
jgi:predicted MPP superfamily phosphohydrolase